MAVSYFGNDEVESWEVFHEEEEDDDDGETLIVEYEGENAIEFDIIGYDFACPLYSESDALTVFYYARKATSEWFKKFWDYQQDCFVPLVFTFDSASGMPDELLNESTDEFSLGENFNDGFFCMNVKLKRKLKKGEKIFFGLWSDNMMPVWSDGSKFEGTGGCHQYHLKSYFSLQRKGMDFDTYMQTKFKSDAKEISPAGNFTMYVRFDGVDPVLYKAAAGGVLEAADGLSRKAVYSKILRTGIDVSEKPAVSRVLKRICAAVSGILDYARGKIRTRNNTVSFYCPIFTEILVECRI